MGIGTSIFLIALGAILKFAVTATVSGIELATVGVILMIVGVIGLAISLMFLSQARRPVRRRPRGRARPRRRARPVPLSLQAAAFQMIGPAGG